MYTYIYIYIYIYIYNYKQCFCTVYGICHYTVHVDCIGIPLLGAKTSSVYHETGRQVIAGVESARTPVSTSHKVFGKSFFKSQFPHKFVNLSFIFTYKTNELTDLRGN